MKFKSIHCLITGIESGVVPPVILETAYRRLHFLFKSPLPDGPIMRDGRNVLDKKYLLYYTLLDFDDRSVLAVVNNLMSESLHISNQEKH